MPPEVQQEPLGIRASVFVKKSVRLATLFLRATASLTAPAQAKSHVLVTLGAPHDRLAPTLHGGHRTSQRRVRKKRFTVRPGPLWSGAPAGI